RYVNVTGRVSSNDRPLTHGRSQSRNLNGGLDGRYAWAGWNFDGHFSDGLTLSRNPAVKYDSTARAYVGYEEDLRVASIDGTASRSMGPRLILRSNGRVSLSRYRYERLGNYTESVRP